MGQAAVRAALTAFLAPPAVTGLNAVYQGLPTWAPGAVWQLDAGQGHGAIAFPEFERSREKREALNGATSGVKSRRYSVRVALLYQWLTPSATIDVTAGLDAWVGPYDALCDAVITRFRSDRTLGTGAGGVVWQAGEGEPGGGEDLEFEADTPVRDGGIVLVWSALQLTLIEMVNS